MRRATLVLVLLAGSLGAQTTVPVSGEPRHHVQFVNESVRVYDVVVPPGDTTLYHVHGVDYTYVTFGAANLIAQVLGSEPYPLALHDGEVRFSKGPLTHRVSNPAPSPFHNLTIELLSRAALSSAPTAPLASGDSLVLENERVRVVRHEIAPGQRAGVATQGGVLDVYLSAGQVVEESDGARGTSVAVQPATFRWHRVHSGHVLRNAGSEPIVVLTILVK
jgi:hypothetical protein